MAKKPYQPVREMKDSLKSSIKSNQRYCLLAEGVLQSHAEMIHEFDNIYGEHAASVEELLDGLADSRMKMLEQTEILKAGLEELNTMKGTLEEKREHFNALHEANYEISFAAAELYSNVTIALLKLAK